MIENKKCGFRAVILQATLLLLPVTSAFFAGSCRMAPKDNPGDTVASAEFYPPDTTQINRLHRADSTAMARRPDSINVFYVGEGSTRRDLQLVSYPSRRDTIVRRKARRIRVEGRADVGSIVRIKLLASHRGDTVVKEVKVIAAENITSAP